MTRFYESKKVSFAIADVSRLLAGKYSFKTAQYRTIMDQYWNVYNRAANNQNKNQIKNDMLIALLMTEMRGQVKSYDAPVAARITAVLTQLFSALSTLGVITKSVFIGKRYTTNVYSTFIGDYKIMVSRELPNVCTFLLKLSLATPAVVQHSGFGWNLFSTIAAVPGAIANAPFKIKDAMNFLTTTFVDFSNLIVNMTQTSSTVNSFFKAANRLITEAVQFVHNFLHDMIVFLMPCLRVLYAMVVSPESWKAHLFLAVGEILISKPHLITHAHSLMNKHFEKYEKENTKVKQHSGLLDYVNDAVGFAPGVVMGLLSFIMSTIFMLCPDTRPKPKLKPDGTLETVEEAEMSTMDYFYTCLGTVETNMSNLTNAEKRANSFLEGCNKLTSRFMGLWEGETLVDEKTQTTIAVKQWCETCAEMRKQNILPVLRGEQLPSEALKRRLTKWHTPTEGSKGIDGSLQAVLANKVELMMAEGWKLSAALLKHHPKSEYHKEVANHLQHFGKVQDENANKYVMAGTTTRSPPIFMVLRGKPGRGKTCAMNFIHSAWFWLMGYTTASEQAYAMENQVYYYDGGKYWNGYKNQIICAMDDAGQKVASRSSPDEFYELMIKLCNAAPYNLSMAHLADKNMHFSSEFITTTTNIMLTGDAATGGINDKGAFQRRITMEMEVVVDPQFMMTLGEGGAGGDKTEQVNEEEVLRVYGSRRSPKIWRFVFCDPSHPEKRPINSIYLGGKHWDVEGGVDFDTVIRILCAERLKRLMEHKENQKFCKSLHTYFAEIDGVEADKDEEEETTSTTINEHSGLISDKWDKQVTEEEEKPDLCPRGNLCAARFYAKERCTKVHSSQVVMACHAAWAAAGEFTAHKFNGDWRITWPSMDQLPKPNLRFNLRNGYETIYEWTTPLYEIASSAHEHLSSGFSRLQKHYQGLSPEILKTVKEHSDYSVKFLKEKADSKVCQWLTVGGLICGAIYTAWYAWQKYRKFSREDRPATLQEVHRLIKNQMDNDEKRWCIRMIIKHTDFSKWSRREAKSYIASMMIMYNNTGEDYERKYFTPQGDEECKRIKMNTNVQLAVHRYWCYFEEDEPLVADAADAWLDWEEARKDWLDTLCVGRLTMGLRTDLKCRDFDAETTCRCDPNFDANVLTEKSAARRRQIRQWRHETNLENAKRKKMESHSTRCTTNRANRAARRDNIAQHIDCKTTAESAEWGPARGRIAKIANNTYEVTACRPLNYSVSGCEEPLGVVGMVNMVQGRIGITARHVVDEMKSSYEHGFVMLWRNQGCKTGVRVNASDITIHSLDCKGPIDMVAIVLKRGIMREAASLMTDFKRQPSHFGYGGTAPVKAFRFYSKEGTIKVSDALIRPVNVNIPATNATLSDYSAQHFYLSTPGKPGQSGGAVYIVTPNGNGCFVGLYRGLHDSNAIGTMLDADILFRQLEKITTENGITIWDIPSEFNEASKASDDHYPGEFDHIAKAVVPSYPPTKSAYEPSPIHGKVAKVKTAPAALKPFKDSDGKKIKPNVNAFAKYGTPNHYIENDLITNVLSAEFNKLKMISYQPKLDKVFSIHEAIYGNPDITYFDAINAASSCGTIGRKNYEDYYGPQTEKINNNTYKLRADYSTPEGDVNKVLYDQVQKFITLMKSNKRPFIPWEDMPKDEPRPIAKVLAGKTRYFSSTSDIAFLVTFRMYFAGFNAAIMQAKIKNGYSVGTNVYGMDWDMTKAEFTHFGDENCFAGDFAGFDSSHNYRVNCQVVDYINKFFYPKATEEENQIRRILWMEITESVHLHEDDVYQWLKGQPSGNPITTILNCIVNNVGMRLVWDSVWAENNNEYMRHQSNFDKYVKHLSYGDDSLTCVHDCAIGIFNQISVSKHFPKFGFEYTDESKGANGEIVPHKHYSEVTYLKRRFVQDSHYGHYIAPLAVETLNKMTQWVKRNGDSPQSQIIERCETAVREAALHDTQFFNYFRTKVEKALDDEGLLQYARLPACQRSIRQEIRLASDQGFKMVDLSNL